MLGHTDLVRDYQVKSIASLARGFEVVRVLQARRAATLHELYLETGIPKPTLLRILRTANEAGLVWQRMVDNAFVPSFTAQPSVDLDDAEWLVELASPIMDNLTRQVLWPSVLAVPRLDHMETVETNNKRTYFDDLPPSPRGWRVNLLRSASGRAYLAWCPTQERESVLQRLRMRGGPGDELARDPREIRRLVEGTRRQGYGARLPDFGGDYELSRRDYDDRRDSIALPIRHEGQVLGTLNLTWRHGSVTRRRMVRDHLAGLARAVEQIEREVVRARPELGRR